VTTPILFLDHAPALGGAERSLLLLLKHLDCARWQPHLACTGGPLAEAATALGVPVQVVPMPRLRRSRRFLRDWLVGARAIAHLARQTGAVLIHANTVRSALYGALAARLAGIPFVWHIRDFWLSESRPHWGWADTLGKRLLCAGAARVIANSQAVAAHLPCRRKVTVVYNGIEIERFDPAMNGAPFRARYGIPPDAPLVGTVGRLRSWKGQDRFLQAAAQVARAVSEAHFAVIGGSIFGVEDGYEAGLRALADELGLANRVTFTGHLDDVRPALAALDVMAHCSDAEPFGRVLIEAMAMQVPVVAFAAGAVPEIVADVETGLLVPPKDETALAEAVIALLADLNRRREMGQRGRERVAEQFTAEAVAQGVEMIYHRL